MDKPALFRGTGEGITIVFNPDAYFREILEFLKKVLDERKTFFSGGTVVVDPNGTVFGESEEKLLRDLFSEYGVQLKLSKSSKFLPKSEVNAIQEKTVTVPHTLRSGQCINFNGDVVVLGDVNEGAEIKDAKSVYVFGIIRGIVEARESVVSLGFQPLRMTIGGIPYNEKNNGKRYRKPRIAKVMDGKIKIKMLGEKKSLRKK